MLIISSTDGINGQTGFFALQVKMARLVYPNARICIMVPPTGVGQFLCFHIMRQNNVEIIPVAQNIHDLCVRLGKKFGGPAPMFYWFFVHHYFAECGIYIDCGDVFLMDESCVKTLDFSYPFSTEGRSFDDIFSAPTTGVVGFNPSLVPQDMEARLERVFRYEYDEDIASGDEIVLHYLIQEGLSVSLVDFIGGQLHAKLLRGCYSIYSLLRKANGHSYNFTDRYGEGKG